MRIIPAIDIIDGKCVRLEKGDFLKKKVYAEDPLDMAMLFEDHGIRYLHLVDLDGAKIGKVQNQKILERIKNKTDLIIDFGGGIRNHQDVASLINAGADQINIGSLSIKDIPAVDQILELYDPSIIILSPDVINRKIAIHGWQESSDIELSDYILDYSKKGIQYYVCTDIEKDGMLSGASVNLYKDLLDEFPAIKLIASGGVKDITDIEQLNTINVDGVIIGKAIYEGRIDLNNLKDYVS